MRQKKGFDQATEAVIKRPHRDYRYLCHVGWHYEDVHCPRCRAQNAGWATSGIALYSGGTLEVESPDGYVAIAACDCWVGEDEERRLGITRVDRLPPSYRVVSDALQIAWDRESGKPLSPDLPGMPMPIEMEIMEQRIAKQVQRYYKNELKLPHLAENIQFILDAVRPSPRKLIEEGLPPPPQFCREPVAPVVDDKQEAAIQATLAGLGY